MANQTTTNEPSNQLDSDPSTESQQETHKEDDEFKITVKKLDFVVRPRGVLAE